MRLDAAADATATSATREQTLKEYTLFTVDKGAKEASF